MPDVHLGFFFFNLNFPFTGVRTFFNLLCVTATVDVRRPLTNGVRGHHSMFNLC